MSKENVMKVIAGLDIGNGCVKGKVKIDDREPGIIDFTSGVALAVGGADLKSKGQDIKLDIDDIFNTMDARFDTPAVRSNTNRLFGNRGIRSGKALEEFDVASTVSKANQDLSAILVLGSIAGKVLQTYFAEHGELPVDTIKVSARIAVALPISEYKMYRKPYAERFRGIKHMVSIQNFEQPVRIEILIEDVMVLAEGASAQFAINSYGEKFMDSMLARMRERGVLMADIKGSDLLLAQNTMGIDIGEGTVNFPVFQNGRFNPDASMTFPKGYGTVLEQAREALQMNGFALPSRKALDDLLRMPENALNRARKTTAQMQVDREAEGFVEELKLQVAKMLGRVGAYLEVIYVYGGGADPLKEMLYPALIETVQQHGGKDGVVYPVLYLDSQYSRHLNKEGLFIIAEQLAAAAQQAEAGN